MCEKKLLYVSTLDHIVRVMLPHLDGARAAGFRVDVACQFTRFRDDVAAHADSLHHVPMQRFPLHPANAIALAKLVALIRRERYDIVHAHNPTGGFVGRLAATLARDSRGSRRPLRVYTAHGFHFHRHGRAVTNSLYRGIESVAGRMLSDAVLTINGEDYDAARNQVVPENRLFLTSGVGVSAEDDFNPARISDTARGALRDEFRIGDSEYLVSVVGELIPRKRQRDAILAIAQHVFPQNPRVRLLVVGDGAMRSVWESEVRSNGWQNSILFAGFRRDVATILAASDLFIFPSQQEGLPCSVQEALSMAVPVVATDVRGNRDLVDSSCGRLVPLAEPEALANSVLELLALPRSECQAMGQHGRDKMLARYNRPQCVAEWLSIYDTLLGSRCQIDSPSL